MNYKKLIKIGYDIYRELYANSEPKADFDALLKEAIVDCNGRKVIPFMDYEIEKNKMDEIISKHCKKHKLSKHYEDVMKMNIYLGCSPRTKD